MRTTDRHRASRHRARQRRCRRGHASWRDGGQRTAEQHHLGCRAHHGTAARAGSQHSSGARRVDCRSMGAFALGGCRARRQDPCGHRSRTHRQARRRSGASIRHARRSRTTRSSPPTRHARWVSSCCRSTRQSPKPISSRSISRRPRETTGLINRDLLMKAKPTMRLINVARGGIVNEDELAEALRDGVIAGAAIDVFATEPTTESPLFAPRPGDRHPASRRVDPRGARQGRRHDCRHGSAGVGGRVRSLCGQRRRGRGQRDDATVPAPRRAVGPTVRIAGRQRAEADRGVHRRRHRRLRHAHPHAGRVEGLLRLHSPTSR